MDYTPDPQTGLLTAEYVDIFGVPFSLIPFKGRAPGGAPPPEDRPKHEVMALPERKAFEIRFPVVEGYVVSLNRNLVTADVGKVERIVLDAWNTPTAAFVRPQVGYQIGHVSAHGGFGFTLVDRQTYYDSVHPQTIEFEITREIVRALTDAVHPGKERLRRESRSALFPQVLRIVHSYVRERVEFNGLHPCEVGLQTYAQRIIGLLVAAITPDDGKGEAPLLPRLNRYKSIESTERVRFKTVKPVQATEASHLNFVACDTDSWEQAATFQLEQLAKDGVVYCYARNDRLEFNIPYEFYGNPNVYEPDFIVRLRNFVNVVVEIKGRAVQRSLLNFKDSRKSSPPRAAA
jgi:type III restriction enzyme